MTEKTYLPHQQRVVDEKTELDVKTLALCKFIYIGSIFPTLSVDEQYLLKDQCEYMSQYSRILGERIAAF